MCLRTRLGRRAAPVPLAESLVGGVEAMPLGKLTSVSKAPPLCFLPSQRTCGKLAAGYCQKVKDTDSRAVGKEEHRLRRTGGKEQQTLPAM